MKGFDSLRVIVFGVYKFQSRLKIENSIKDNVDIIGYMDNFYNETTFNYRPVFKIDKLIGVDYDYILINSIKTSSIEEIYKQLVEGGIKKEKIIRWYYYSYFGNDSPISRYEKLDMKMFDGFIFGMSHAVDGFFPQFFNKNIYRFCARGMDIWYHKRVLEYVFNKKAEQKIFILELPYYIFNYDLFQTRFFKYRIKYIKEVDGLENANLADDNYTFLKEYEAFENVFKMETGAMQASSEIPLSNVDTVLRLDFEEEIFQEFWSIDNTAIERNRNYLNEIVQLIYKNNKDAKVAVVVFPHNVMEINKLSEQLDKVKKVFFDSINEYCEEGKITLFDYFDLYKERPELFKDWTHLNNRGAEEFTRRLNIDMQGRIY